MQLGPAITAERRGHRRGRGRGRGRSDLHSARGYDDQDHDDDHHRTLRLDAWHDRGKACLSQPVRSFDPLAVGLAPSPTLSVFRTPHTNTLPPSLTRPRPASHVPALRAARNFPTSSSYPSWRETVTESEARMYFQCFFSQRVGPLSLHPRARSAGSQYTRTCMWSSWGCESVG
jgi:hypothetical protein